ncbi:MAG: hypothetical protein HYU69_10630 [Bacteroidetes bacterium]|nr:hypothetical protein [Bacteroidota bacterium]
MRIVGNLNKHPKITTTIFQMNDKYIIKFEAGNMEQVFKIAQTEVGGIDTIDKMLTEDFITKVIERFNEMFLSFKGTR